MGIPDIANTYSGVISQDFLDEKYHARR